VATMISPTGPPPSAVATQLGAAPILLAETVAPRKECPKCGKASRVPSTLLGRRVKCPHCGAGLGRLSPTVVEPGCGLHMILPAVVSLEAARTHRVAIKLLRRNCPGPVELRLSAPGHGLTARNGFVSADADEGFVELAVDQGTPPGSWALRVIAIGGTARAEADLEVTLYSKGRPRELANAIGMKLVLIPSGSFPRGSPVEEGGDDERPQRRITITQPFYLGVFQVTQQEYRHVVGTNPSSFRVAGIGSEHIKGLDTNCFPVESVSWHDAVRFCEKLSALEPEREAGRVYRLPTEAEWELACRGGSAFFTSFHFGQCLSSTQANFNGTFPFGPGARKGVSLRRPTTVGNYPENGFGLFDMHGNVWEWCADWYDPGYYAVSRDRAPPGPEDGVYRVARGGSWFNDGGDCRSASRNARKPDQRDDLVGFRVVCMVPGGG